jgi:NAD(P)-dependent dehydrogenase (short-subunit alcohol dehydrogenase family)
MGNELAGKVAIVTGGASGIGYAAAKKFLAEGARVVIADVDRDGGEALAAAHRADAVFKWTDVRQPDHVAELVSVAVETFGGLHIMLNNAGVSGAMHESFLDDDLADFQRVMAVNLLGVMAGTKFAARQMASNAGGSIINTSSIGGIQAGGGVMTYRASKAAVIHFTKSAALELAQFGIRVNCIAPGHIPTPLLASSTRDMTEEAREQFVTATRELMRANRPLEREGTAADVAEAAVYYASDRSAYVTGTVLPIDGGTVAGTPMKRRADFAPTSASGVAT